MFFIILYPWDENHFLAEHHENHFLATTSAVVPKIQEEQRVMERKKGRKREKYDVCFYVVFSSFKGMSFSLPFDTESHWDPVTVSLWLDHLDSLCHLPLGLYLFPS